MKLNAHIRWSVVILVTLLVVQFIVLAVLVYNSAPLAGFDVKTVKPVVDFTYKGSLMCSILYSTHSKGKGVSLPWHEVQEFTLSSLDTDQPRFGTSYFSQSVALRKSYESDDYITLENEEEGRDTQTIGIMKKTGTFVRTMTGLQAGIADFHYSIAQKGFCE